jgi:hypothetical protein
MLLKTDPVLPSMEKLHTSNLQGAQNTLEYIKGISTRDATTKMHRIIDHCVKRIPYPAPFVFK